jgi:hypothetical protein
MRHWLPVLGLAAVLAACGGDGSGGGATGITVRCLFAGDTCSELTAPLTSGQRSQLASDCGTAGGAYAVGTCPTDGAVPGHCAYTGTAFTAYTGLNLPGGSLREYFYTAAWTPIDAEAWCAAPPAGTWVP